MINSFRILIKIAVLFLILLFNILVLQAQNYTDPTIEKLRRELQKSSEDTNRVNTLLELSNYYIDPKSDLDSALLVARQALQLSESLKFPNVLNNSLRQMGVVLIRKKETEAGMVYVNRLTDILRDTKKQNEEADLLFQIGKLMPNVKPADAQRRLNLYQQAITLYNKLGLVGKEIEAKVYLSRIEMEKGRYDLAEKGFLALLNEANAKSTKEPLLRIYEGLVELAIYRSNRKKGMEYALDILRTSDQLPSTIEIERLKADCYFHLAFSYDIMKNYTESKKMALKGLQLARSIKYYLNYYKNLQQYTRVLHIEKKSDEITAFLQESLMNFPPINQFQRRTMAIMIGYNYLKQKKVKEAAPYFEEADELIKSISKENLSQLTLENTLTHHYYEMALYYLNAKKYDQAKRSLDKIDEVSQAPRFNTLRSIAMMCYITIDTILRDYRSAYEHHVKYKALTDSAMSIANSTAMTELTVKYQTEKKDQDLMLRQQSIDLLTKQKQIQDGKLIQASLQIQLEKQQRLQQKQLNALQAEKREKDFKLVQYNAERKDIHISLLNKQAQFQVARLENATLMRNMTISGLILTIIIIALLYRSYRLKKINNVQLAHQRNEIHSKNQSLQKLVSEKEWLLRELHHRVKNNLQIVASLLNIQGYYLEDSPALPAIRETQLRVHSISLIHKKLYLGENVGHVHMPEYIIDLVNDLKQSFTTAQRIQFQVEIDDIALDTSKAVPLGLILNEAITNAIKYAFPSDRTGTIKISLRQTKEEKITIIIADDGIGLPTDVSNKMTGSLGMSIIQGLSGELDGVCKIMGYEGTSIIIEFPHNNLQEQTKGYHSN